MKIDVKRFEFATTYTISKLYIDGKYQCFVLEDVVREVEGQPVSVWKIPHATAIPKGTYTVVIDKSTRFGRIMPHLLDVPGFEGIRIHSGNTDKDTEGCLLLGYSWAGTDWIGESRKAFDDFFTVLQAAVSLKEQIVLTLS